MNFLCISLFFLPFVFVVFFSEICGRHFLKHNNAKTNSFQPLRVKISIFIWTMRKNSICIDFVHKITFWSHFRSDVHVQKSYVTSEPYPRASQIWCQNVRETRKKKVIKCRGESFARCRVIARNVEGGPKGPPVFLGLKGLMPLGLHPYLGLLPMWSTTLQSTSPKSTLHSNIFDIPNLLCVFSMVCFFS